MKHDEQKNPQTRGPLPRILELSLSRWWTPNIPTAVARPSRGLGISTPSGQKRQQEYPGTGGGFLPKEVAIKIHGTGRVWCNTCMQTHRKWPLTVGTYIPS